MTAAALVVFVSALALTVVSVLLKRADEGDAETLREWLGLEEGEQP